MRNCLSPSPNIKTIPYFNRNMDCECNCHFPDDCNNDDFLTLTTRGSNCFSLSPMRSTIKSAKCEEIKNNNEGLCVCENVCNCPCHCISCVCCPCGKGKSDEDKGEYYRNLYLQTKSELELEKKRNERMKYNKKMHENNMENSQKEKEILLTEIEQLKKKLAETMNKLKEQAENNMAKEDELFTFKQEEIPKIKESYEKMIKKIKDDANKEINYLNNELNALTKENMELKLKLKKKMRMKKIQ